MRQKIECRQKTSFTLFSMAQIPILNFVAKVGSLNLVGKTERFLSVVADGDFLNILTEFLLLFGIPCQIILAQAKTFQYCIKRINYLISQILSAKSMFTTHSMTLNFAAQCALRQYVVVDHQDNIYTDIGTMLTLLLNLQSIVGNNLEYFIRISNIDKISKKSERNKCKKNCGPRIMVFEYLVANKNRKKINENDQTIVCISYNMVK